MWNRQIDSLEVSYATLVTAQEEAREELQVTSARNFLKSGFPADVIAENLDLPLEQVLQLQRELTANT